MFFDELQDVVCQRRKNTKSGPRSCWKLQKIWGFFQGLLDECFQTWVCKNITLEGSSNDAWESTSLSDLFSGGCIHRKTHKKPLLIMCLLKFNAPFSNFTAWMTYIFGKEVVVVTHGIA